MGEINKKLQIMINARVGISFVKIIIKSWNNDKAKNKNHIKYHGTSI